MYNFLYHFPNFIWAVLGVVLAVFDLINLIMYFFGDDDKKENKKKYLAILTISAIICFILYPIKNNLVEMPKVTPNTYANAIQLLDSCGISYEADIEVSDYTKTIVGGQSIAEGEIINKKKATVILYINSISNDDSMSVTLPQVTGVFTQNEDTTTNYTAEKNFEDIDENTNNWSIEIINKVDSPIQTGNDMIVDLAICTPSSQYSTPYILYAGYFDRNIWNWVQFFALKIPAEQSHVNLTIDTYLLGLPKGDYIFSFDLFRAEDYSFGNSCASTAMEIKLLGENTTFEDDVFDRNVVKHEFLDYYIIQDEKYPEDTEKLSLINVNNTDIKTIAYLSNLKELDITGSDITDIEPLKKLKKLESFSVHSNNLSNISVVENMPYLEYLSIGGENYNGIGTHGVLEDISSIQNLKLLTTLTIYDCNVKDISCIENLKMLEYISIFKTKVDDISALTDLRFIKELKLHANNIKDITPLNNIPNLTRLVISNNNLSEEQINEFKESHPDCRVYSKD